MKKIPEKIRCYRIRNSWTQRDLAVRLMVSPGTISEWERGRRTPKIVNLLRLAMVFDVNEKEFREDF